MYWISRRLTFTPYHTPCCTNVLKGGTAINLFVREDLPRLSVDIDLIYLSLQSREESLLGTVVLMN
jgi:predicted nucleotidyltransferase component of viral defense system